MSASMFDFGPMSDEIAERLRRGAIGLATAFPQAPDIAWPGADAAARPASPLPRAGLADPAQTAPAPVPLPPARPAELSIPDADAPASGAVPIMAAPASPVGGAPAAAPEGPSFGDTFRKGLMKDNGDYLGALAAGLLSSPTWAGGISAGIQLASKGEKDRAVTDLAKAEYGLKARKLAQETGALKGNAAILKKAYPSLSDEEAMAQGSNSSAVTEALKILRNPSHGREKDDVQLVTRPDGSIVAINKSQIGETSGAPAVTPVVPGASKLAAEADERRALVLSQGKDPNDPRYADFIVSGSLPKENQQQLTASDKQAVREGRDRVRSALIALQQLEAARKLSDKAYDGVTAPGRAVVMSNLPGALGGPSQAALDTREMQNLITTQALSGMKAIFGANPTEGERKALESMQGAAEQPMDLRNNILDEAIRQARSRAEYEQDTVNDLLGGTIYKPSDRGGAPAVTAPKARGAAAEPVGRQSAPSGYSQPKTRADYDGLPSGAKYIAPDGSVRVKP